jgi:small subunit ribosomal protein S9
MPAKAPTNKKTSYVFAVGRRKRAIARVRLYTKETESKELDMTINDQPVAAYFHNPLSEIAYTKPLKVTDTISNFRVTVKVYGSGLESQLDAVCHGVARALVKVDETHKSTLRQHGFLTRDPRKKQRRMIGTGGKSRRQKQSPKR